MKSLQGPITIPASFVGVAERNEWIRNNRVSTICFSHPSSLYYTFTTPTPTHPLAFLKHPPLYMPNHHTVMNNYRPRLTDYIQLLRALETTEKGPQATEEMIRILGADYDSLEGLISVTIPTKDDRLRGTTISKDDVRFFSCSLQ
jgi:hypothetical protein